MDTLKSLSYSFDEFQFILIGCYFNLDKNILAQYGLFRRIILLLIAPSTVLVVLTVNKNINLISLNSFIF